MRVSITTEQRFVRTPAKRFWASAASPCSFWRRYLDAFDEVRVIAGVAAGTARPPGAGGGAGSAVAEVEQMGGSARGGAEPEAGVDGRGWTRMNRNFKQLFLNVILICVYRRPCGWWPYSESPAAR
jgi:hypothetical protein